LHAIKACHGGRVVIDFVTTSPTPPMWIRAPLPSSILRGCRGRNHIIVGFTTTYAISAYHHWCCDCVQVRCTRYNIMW